MDDWESRALAEPPLDFHWVTDRLAVGGAIWTRSNMELLAQAGITHIVDMQAEFDDAEIAEGTGIQVFWNPCDDDFQEKDGNLFRRGVAFAWRALQDPAARIYFHCSAGVHRGPMMLLAFLAAQGMDFGEAMDLIRSHRIQAEFPDVYRRSVARFLESLPATAADSR
jgi:protein-tyrosine phosphatase